MDALRQCPWRDLCWTSWTRRLTFRCVTSIHSPHPSIAPKTGTKSSQEEGPGGVALRALPAATSTLPLLARSLQIRSPPTYQPASGAGQACAVLHAAWWLQATPCRRKAGRQGLRAVTGAADGGCMLQASPTVWHAKLAASHHMWPGAVL